MEIRPEPTPAEREAIVSALAQLDGDAEPSQWWLAGVHESLGKVDED